MEAAARPRVRGVGGTGSRVGGADRRPSLQGDFGLRRRCREGEVSARRRAVGREAAHEPQDVGPRQSARFRCGCEYHARDRAHSPQPVRLKWSASSEVRGTVASVGARLLKGTAQKLTESFWDKFAARVGEAAGSK